MDLHVFNREAQQEWIDTGYPFVKLSAAENVGFEESFTLLEPYSGEEDVSAHKDIVSVRSAEIEKIIRDGSGRYAK